MGKDDAVRVAIRCIIVEEITKSLTDAELCEFSQYVQLESDATKRPWYGKVESFYATQEITSELTKEAVRIVWKKRKAKRILEQQNKKYSN
jgi:hypothetical protein